MNIINVLYVCILLIEGKYWYYWRNNDNNSDIEWEILLMI